MLTKPTVKFIEANESLTRLKERMLTRENKSVETLSRYLEGVKSFTSFFKAESPDKALQALQACKDVTLTVDDYVSYLQNVRHLKARNLKSHFFGVKKWLTANRVNGVDWPYISRPKTASMIQDRIPSRRELQVILSNRVTLRDRALFLVAASSGLRIGTLGTLKISEYTPKEELGMITVVGGPMRKLSEGRRYFTFITAEARKALEDYLLSRGPLDKDCSLFAGLGKTRTQPLSQYAHNVGRQWRILLRRSGLMKKIPGHSFSELHPHTLRKFFQTNCKLSGCRSDLVDYWLGHHPVGVDAYLNDAYLRAPEPVHVEEYRKAVSALTVFGVEASKEQVNQLAAEVEKLRGFVKVVISENMKLRGQNLKRTFIHSGENIFDEVDKLQRRIKELEQKG